MFRLSSYQGQTLQRLQSTVRFKHRSATFKYRPLPNGKFETIILQDEEVKAALLTCDSNGKVVNDVPWMEAAGSTEEAALNAVLAKAQHAGGKNPNAPAVIADELAEARRRVEELEKRNAELSNAVEEVTAK